MKYSIISLFLFASLQSNGTEPPKLEELMEPLPMERCFAPEDNSELARLFSKNLEALLPKLVAIPTVRTEELNTAEELEKIQDLKDILDNAVKKFNKNSPNKLRPFEWKKEVDKKQFWVFGYRLGKGDRKISLFTHVDVVPARAEDAFKLSCQNRMYQGKVQPFLVGRGALDDKGPTISTLSAIQMLALSLNPNALKNFTIELIVDTSEEVEFGVHYYFNDENKNNRPDFGVVVDAAWCTLAEKGIERPVFSFKNDKKPKKGLYIKSLKVPEGNPANVIPDYVEAEISGKDKDALEKLANNIEELYKKYEFDDPNYRRAKIVTSKKKDGTLTLRTEVMGAQHGSAPQENRSDGANPLVSLLNFLASLVENKTLERNAYADVALFAKDIFGTKVFGENYPELLEKSDDIFREEDDNGTTYAITKVEDEDNKVNLLLDVRYTLDHHKGKWDGKTYGTLKGDSKFKEIFNEIVDKFNKKHSLDVSVETKTVVGPDLKDKKSEAFVKVNKAFKSVMNRACPRKAIGGATDAKGESNIITAGSLFKFGFGYPTYYHGKSEGAPVNDLYKTSQILLKLLTTEINSIFKEKLPFKLWLRRE